MKEEHFQIPIEGQDNIRAISTSPDNPKARILMAHGAGAGMTHRFMDQAALALVDRGIAVVRFNFPYMEAGRKRPDIQKKSVHAFKCVIDYVTRDQSVPWFIGGKSYGGRMATHVMAQNPELPIFGLIFWGFPLHAPGKPSTDRAAHLPDVRPPMLFLQGTRDALADLALLEPLIHSLDNAELYICEGADHSFHVLKSSGTNDLEVMSVFSDKISQWIDLQLP